MEIEEIGERPIQEQAAVVLKLAQAPGAPEKPRGVARGSGALMVAPLGAGVPGSPDAMETWTVLTEAEECAVWDRFYRDFAFQPSVSSEDWPGIHEPIPSITYAIPQGYTEDDLDDLHRQVLGAFRACTRPEERLYALDWQHLCFWFRPHSSLEPPSGHQEAWPPVLPSGDFWRIPVLPDGDYYIFLAEDFRFGIFGHPWERTWCVFGAELLAALEAGRPRMFSSIRRRSGKGATP